MIRIRWSQLTIISSLLIPILVFSINGKAQAANGIANSVKFGIGAKLNPQTANMDKVVQSASQVGFNWLAVEFDWAKQWADRNSPINFNKLAETAKASQTHQTSLMVVIKNPPAWAMTNQGPDIQYIDILVINLMQSLPNNVAAIELIPGANRANNWGAPANPPYYASMIKQIQSTVMMYNPRTLILASITPLGIDRVDGDMEDIDFLNGLYQVQEQNYPVIGINFSKINGDPDLDPANDPAHNLRHYEKIRKVMLDNGRSRDVIWVTNFSWPTNLSKYQDQSIWLYDAFKLLRTQLFIGVAFFTNLNSTPDTQEPYLISDNLTYHPASYMVQQLADDQVDSTLKTSYVPGHSQSDQEQTFLEILWLKILSWFSLP